MIARHLEDRGGGLARVDDRAASSRAWPCLTTNWNRACRITTAPPNWVDIDRLLDVFGLTRQTLADSGRVNDAVRALAARMPTYITLKDAKKRWGKGQDLPGT